ncbi:hypothetical protein HPB47_017505 [Ixodes persulcatus]|uniref:Uncharacterized protein n=1 Tax=Ixodes persulcatus TaxID=34615 RepID=A0AC60QRP0_IXOPE|nr:hypothetical protein HPB47_017505 [Ixodes persulcatus]
MVQKVDKHSLHRPSLEEVAKALSDGLRSNFEHVQVDVVDCPDLRQKPFMLASEGICGQPRLTDIGGVPYLVPIVQTDKIYDLEKVMKQTDVPDGFAIGAGAGPYHTVGINCEMMLNMKCGQNPVNKSHYAKIGEDGSCVLGKLSGPPCEFCLMGNFLISEGKQGKVIKVSAKKRTGQENFVTAMRNGLKAKYGTEPVGMGGAFLLAQGKAKLHIMPKFSTAPLLTDAAMNQWLKFFEMSAPLVCLSTFVSHDPGWDLRIEHTHCFSDHKQGGHYHYDTTPDEVEYLGYFNVAEWLYRIDAPASTHKIGRD